MFSDQDTNTRPGKVRYTIREVADMIQEAPSLLRFWEKKFPSIKPQKDRKGARMYTANDIRVIKQIHSLVKEKGYTLEGAKLELQKLKRRGGEDRLIEDLLKVKNFFVAMLDKV